MNFVDNSEKCAQYWPDCRDSMTSKNLLSPATCNPEASKSFGQIGVKTLGETLVEFDTYRRILQIIKTEPSEYILVTLRTLYIVFYIKNNYNYELLF